MKLKFNGFLVLFAVLMTQITFAQERVVTGVVSDNSGLPLPGVSVLVKGTQSSTQSDFDGKYSIKATPSQVLVFSYIGMKSQEANASSAQVNIKLLSSEEQLSEVVVTGALGIKRAKKSIGSAQTTIQSDELNRSSQINIADALKGKVAGVVVNGASTDPGASSGVIIRGFSTLSGSNQPLYVVDGTPISDNSNFSSNLTTGGYDFGRGSGDINPNDIETMTVLKGASATALYGSRAANGAIIITTKRGKLGKVTIEINSALTFSTILRTPKYQTEFGQGWDGVHALAENGSWGPRFDGSPRVWGNVVDNSQLLKPYSFQKDQLEKFFDTGVSKFNSVSISGGSESSTARLSYSNTQQDGIYPTDADSYGRHTLGISASTKVNKLSFSGNLNYVKTSGSGVVTGQGLSTMNNLMQIPTDIPITEFKDYKNPFHNVSNYYTPYGITNPYFTLNEDGTNYSKDRVYGSFDVSYEINKWSNLTYRFGLDHSNDLLKKWVAQVDALPGSPNDGSSTEQEGSYAEFSRTLNQFNHDLLYNLNFDLSEKLNIVSTFGWNANERSSYTSSATVGTQDIPGFYSFSNSSQSAVVSSTISNRKLYGLYNSTTLSYNDQLFLTGNIRNDWYSTLPKENQSIVYGGVNASWVFTNTFPAIKDIVSYGKLRAGYGSTGVDTDPYQVLSVYVPGSIDNQGFQFLDFPLNGVNAYEVGNRAANPNLKPEVKKEFEVGTELSFIKNRINVDFTYYNAKVENQILSLPLAPSSGYTSQTANVGTISNEGIEALVSIAIFKNKNEGFNWTTTFNYSKNNSILEKLDPRISQVALGGLSTTSFIARQGQPLALIFGNVAEKDPNGNIVVDANGIPVLSPNKEVYGDTQYDYTLGIGNNFTYKNFSLDFSFDIRQGGLMYSRTADITRFTGNSITTTYNDRQAFIVPNSVVKTTSGSGVVTYAPNTVAVDSNHMDDYYRADALDRETVIDKSFIKLREVVLSYNFTKFMKGTGLNNLTLSVIGRNLFIWTPSSNQYIDPETSTFGTDIVGQFGEFSANPSTRSVGFSLKANF